MFSTEINKLNETRSGHCKTQNRIGLLNTDFWLVIFLDNKYTEEHLIKKYFNLHENSLILVTETKVNNLSFCFLIANVHISLYLYSIDIQKFSKKIHTGYFYC